MSDTLVAQPDRAPASFTADMFRAAWTVTAVFMLSNSPTPLYVVWQQNRASQTNEGSHVSAGDLFDSWSAPGDNIFLVKSTIWLSR